MPVIDPCSTGTLREAAGDEDDCTWDEYTVQETVPRVSQTTSTALDRRYRNHYGSLPRIGESRIIGPARPE